MVGEVTALSHEVGDDSVEGAALEVEALSLLTGAESAEVLRGDGGVVVELDGDTASGGAADRDVEEDSGVGSGSSHF